MFKLIKIMVLVLMLPFKILGAIIGFIYNSILVGVKGIEDILKDFEN